MIWHTITARHTNREMVIFCSGTGYQMHGMCSWRWISGRNSKRLITTCEVICYSVGTKISMIFPIWYSLWCLTMICDCISMLCCDRCSSLELGGCFYYHVRTTLHGLCLSSIKWACINPWFISFCMSWYIHYTCKCRTLGWPKIKLNKNSPTWNESTSGNLRKWHWCRCSLMYWRTAAPAMTHLWAAWSYQCPLLTTCLMLSCSTKSWHVSQLGACQLLWIEARWKTWLKDS